MNKITFPAVHGPSKSSVCHVTQNKVAGGNGPSWIVCWTHSEMREICLGDRRYMCDGRRLRKISLLLREHLTEC